MRNFLRWWDTLDRPERIVAMSLSAGTLIAIVNSTTWAIAVSYMTYQKTRVALAAERSRALPPPRPPRPDAAPSMLPTESQPLGADALGR
jgi:hypothetical protein